MTEIFIAETHSLSFKGYEKLTIEIIYVALLEILFL